MDSFLFEAMREVDAMLPGTPPITPVVNSAVALMIAGQVLAARSLAEYEYWAQRNALVNVGNRVMTAEEYHAMRGQAFLR